MKIQKVRIIIVGGIFSGLVLFGLNSCGYKGPLYLPKTEPRPKAAPLNNNFVPNPESGIESNLGLSK